MEKNKRGTRVENTKGTKFQRYGHITRISEEQSCTSKTDLKKAGDKVQVG